MTRGKKRERRLRSRRKDEMRKREIEKGGGGLIRSELYTRCRICAIPLPAVFICDKFYSFMNVLSKQRYKVIALTITQ